MPNVLTHGLMALKAKEHVSASQIQQAISKHRDVYLFGSNGPDFLFYYNVWPWLDQKEADRVSEHGTIMHKEKINEFIDTMIAIAKKQTNNQARNIMISFIAGYLCHWALDSVAHPFVFYRSGNMNGKRKYDHYRYESMIDSKMVVEVYQEKLSKYPSKKFLSMNKTSERVVSFLVSHAHQRVYDSTLSSEECLSAMKRAKQILPLFFDPYTIKHRVIRPIEQLMLDGQRVITSHMVIGRLNHMYDELNINRQVWYNPTYPDNPHNESFIELFERSVGRAKVALVAFENILNEELDTMSNVILNRSFNTDRFDGAKMVVFDNIYVK